MQIAYHFEDVILQYFDEAQISAWLLTIADREGSTIKHINYIFCTDEYLLSINKEYLNHDYYTDIITFPYIQGKTIESDIFISVERVNDNAAQFDQDPKIEMNRVIVHGLLHLIGYGDKTEEEAQKMREKEDEALALL